MDQIFLSRLNNATKSKRHRSSPPKSASTCTCLSKIQKSTRSFFVVPSPMKGKKIKSLVINHDIDGRIESSCPPFPILRSRFVVKNFGYHIASSLILRGGNQVACPTIPPDDHWSFITRGFLSCSPRLLLAKRRRWMQNFLRG